MCTASRLVDLQQIEDKQYAADLIARGVAPRRDLTFSQNSFMPRTSVFRSGAFVLGGSLNDNPHCSPPCLPGCVGWLFPPQHYAQ